MSLKLEEKRRLFKATASVDTPEGVAARKAFASALTIPILQKVEELSMVRQLFAVERLDSGAQASYPVADEYEVPVWVLPGLGYMAQNFIEGVGDEIFVPTFAINASADWKVTFARDGRVDIAERAAKSAAKAIVDYEEECGWKVIMPAVTTAFTGMGLLGPRPAPIAELSAADPAAGYLSKELINKMMVGMVRTGRTLTDLFVSPEDSADIREWTDTDIDPVTRREIFQAAGMGKIWNVTIHETKHLGALGKFTIHGNDSEYGVFKANASSEYNDYTLDNPNELDSDGNLTTLGETQILGFDLSVNDSLVMPIRKEYEAIDDPTLLRRQKAGFFGWNPGPLAGNC